MASICQYIIYSPILSSCYSLGLSTVLSLRTYLYRCPVGSGFWSAPLRNLDCLSLKIFVAVHIVRIRAIYDMNRSILLGMSALFAVQVVVTGICCAFYRGTLRFYCSLLYVSLIQLV